MKNYNIGVVFLLVVSLMAISMIGVDDVNAAGTRELCKVGDSDNRYIIGFKKNDAARTVTVTAAYGSFDVKVTGSSGTAGNIDQNHTLTAGTPLVISFADKKSDFAAKISVVLNADDTDGRYCAKGGYKKEYLYSYSGQDELVENSNYNGVCKEFRDGYYSQQTAKGQTFLRDLLGYCFTPQVPNNYKSADVTSMIANAKSAWTSYEKSAGNLDTDFGTSEGFEKIDNKKTNMKSVPLQCDPFAYDESNPNDSNVKKYYTTDKVFSSDVCDVECKEELTVSYGPPVSVKAGLCFEYTVTVRSKVSCKRVVKEKKPTMPKVCNPYPICNGTAEYYDQGGPSEDFDQCVTELDGGKYLQSSINKCYNQVYKKSTSKVAAAIDNVTPIQKMASCGVKGKKEGDYKAIYQAIQDNSNGSYYWSGETIKWKNDGSCYWDGIGRYYFNSLDKAGRTVKNINGEWWGGFNPDLSGGYSIGTGGFKVGQVCHDQCTWNVDNCSKKNDYLNADDAAKAYKKELADYNNAIEKCSNYAKCDDKTATFTMKVKKSSDGKWETFGAENVADSKEKKPTGEYPSIINEQSGVCYGKKNADGDDYKTVINFPGSWINNKNGKVTFTKPPSNQEIFYEGVPNQFCTPLDSKNVNESWWEWDQYYKRAENKKSTVKVGDIDYNIEAVVEDFGLFDWDLKVQCFYAINNDEIIANPPTCTGADCNVPTTSGDSDNDNDGTGDGTTIDNYKFRTVALTNMFPSQETATGQSNLFDNNNAKALSTLTTQLTATPVVNATEAGRDTGWNWSCDATNLGNSDYGITPTALITDIQAKGNSIYKDDSNVDYAIRLTPADIAYIKQYNQNKDYFDYTDATLSSAEAKRAKGLTLYKSDFINQMVTRRVVTKRGVIGCNNQEGNNCAPVSTVNTDACVASLGRR